MSSTVKSILGWVATIAGGTIAVTQALGVQAAATVPSWVGTTVAAVAAALHLL